MTRARNISRILSAQEISGDINLSGIVTATEFYGDGSNLTGIENAVTQNVSTSGLNVSGMTTLGNATAGVATANQFSGNITGTAATFSGNVTVGGVLTYDDVTNVDSLGIITARSGVSIADSIFHTGDTNTAIRFPAADTFTVETGGSERVRVTSDGKVGINSASPHQALDIGGTTVSLIKFTPSNYGSGASDGAQIGVNFGGLDIWQFENNYLRLGTNNTERLRITSGGNLGIGSAAPTFLTDILSGVQNTGANINNPSQLSVTGPNKTLTGGGANVFINSNSDLAADTGGSIAFSGRNTTSSTNSVVHATIKGAKENATSTNGDAYLAFAVQNHSAGALVERLRIDSSGNVGINETSPATTLDVDGTISDSIGPLRRLGQEIKSGDYTLVAGDAGKHIRVDGNHTITVPDNVFTSGDMITIVANSASTVAITQGSGLNLYNASDGTTGSKTMAARTVATILFAEGGSGAKAYISGGGLS